MTFESEVSLECLVFKDFLDLKDGESDEEMQRQGRQKKKKKSKNSYVEKGTKKTQRIADEKIIEIRSTSL